jgi:hypothetical protein
MEGIRRLQIQIRIGLGWRGPPRNDQGMDEKKKKKEIRQGRG